MKYQTFENGDKMPALGLGTWKSEKGDVYKAVRSAIEIGYRHIDCAPIYGNEQEIGDAINDAIKAREVSREELWITSKLWNNAHGKSQVKPALQATLSDLQLDYLDLYLIHWPVAIKDDLLFPAKAEDLIGLQTIPISETWEGMTKVKKSGLAKHIGVSNFSLKKLKDLVADSGEKPEVNQIEMHPYLQQPEMLAFCKNEGINLTAYSPLGSSDRPNDIKKAKEPSLFENPALNNIALAKNCNVAQVLLAWAVNRGTSVIPKSINPMHQQQNFLSTHYNFNELQQLVLDNLDKNYRFIDGSFWTPEGSPYTMENLWDEK